MSEFHPVDGLPGMSLDVNRLFRTLTGTGAAQPDYV